MEKLFQFYIKKLLLFSKAYFIYFRFGIMMMIKYCIQTLRFTICIQSLCSQLSTVNQQRHHPRPHLNQQTQCHTKDSGFYCTSLFVTDSHNSRRETALSGRQKSQKQRRFTFVNFFSASNSPFFTISFSLKIMLSSFSLQIFLFYTCV